MDTNWLRVGDTMLHVPTIAYIEKLAPATANGSPVPQVQVGFMGGAFRVLQGADATALLGWVAAQSRASDVEEISIPR